jgi:hypothetical protein
MSVFEGTPAQDDTPTLEFIFRMRICAALLMLVVCFCATLRHGLQADLTSTTVTENVEQ